MAAEDRRVLKTKKLIDDTCWALMQEKPFEEITEQDIAKRAAINRATFYRYHADKFDCLEKKIRQMVAKSLPPLEKMRFHYSMSAGVGAIEWWLRNDRPISCKAMARELSRLHGGENLQA